MSTVSFDRELFHEKLVKLLPFIPKKSVTPALENIKVEVKSGVAELMVSDGQTEIKLFSDAKHKEDMSFCLPAILFIKTIGLFRENEVRITVLGNKITLKSGKSNYKITTDTTPNEYPRMTLRDVSGEISVLQSHLKKGLAAGETFVGKGLNEVLNGVHIAFVERQIVFTGAEQQLLCRYACAPVSVNRWSPIILPPDTANKVCSVLNDIGEINITASKDKVLFSANTDSMDRVEVMSTLKDSKYPNSEALFKTIPEEAFVADTLEISSALKRLKLYAFQEIPSVEISSTTDGEIRMVVVDDLTGKEGDETLTVREAPAKPFTKNYHIDQLLQILKEVPNKEISFHYNPDSKKPSHIVPIPENPDAQDNIRFLVVAIIEGVA